MANIYVLCPDTNARHGGIKKLYRHVDVLNNHGFSAFIVHQQNKFRCTWFENVTKVTYLAEIKFDESDYLVIPETYGPNASDICKGVKKVIFNQNAYYTFQGYSIDSNDFNTPYLNNDVKAALVVSEDNKKYLQYAFPELKVFRINNGIDSSLFNYSANKKRQIAFMTSKQPGDLTQVINILKFRGVTKKLDLVAIANKSEAEVASILKDSLIFLWFTYQEGWPLPPAEAMACGCIVVGYHGIAGQECLKSEFTYPIPPGDIINFAETVEKVIEIYNEEPLILQEKAKQASDYIKHNHFLEKEEEDIVKAWNDILNTTDNSKVTELTTSKQNNAVFDFYSFKIKKYSIIEPVTQEHSRPLWSVMIPTYNGKKYLEQTLKSVLEQDPGSDLMQIEVIDDCSTQDNPEELVKEIGQGRISFYKQPKNLGLIGNWNACINRARGHWVHILHQDDVVKTGFYSSLQTALEKEPNIGAAFCRYFYMDEKGYEQDLSHLERETPGVISNWIERIAVMQRIEFPAIVVKREAYEKLGGFCQEAYYAADWEMWKRIATYYPVWYEPKLLACYRVHSSSESSRLVTSGKNIADTRKAIEISESYLPTNVAAELSKQARENCAFKALNIARRMLATGEIEPAIAQMREGIKSSQSSNIFATVLELIYELVGRSNQYDSLPINALDQFLSAFQKPFQEQQSRTFIDSLNLRKTNLIIFPDWSQPAETLYQDLSSVITNLIVHPNKHQITLLIYIGDTPEDEVSLLLSDVVMNLLLEEGLDVANDPEISLFSQLSSIQLEALLPHIHAQIILNHENKDAIAVVKAENIPTCEIDSLNQLTSDLV